MPRDLFAFIWCFLKEFRIPASIYIFLAIVAGFWGPFNAILIKNIINLLTDIDKSDTSILMVYTMMIGANFIVFDNFTWRTISYIRGKYAPVIINNIMQELADYTLRKPHQFFQDNLSGKISKQITNIADGIEKIITSVAANFLRGASVVFATFVTAFFVNPMFCFILIIWFSVFILLSIFMSKKLVLLSDVQSNKESVVVGELVDGISNSRNIRMFFRYIFEKNRMKPFFESQREAYRAVYTHLIIMQSVQGGLIAIMMFFSAYCLVYLYEKNMVTAGDFALILGLCMETGHIMWFTMSEVDEFNKASGKAKAGLSALIENDIITDKNSSVELICSKGEIIFENIKFHYKGTNPLFENKSIKIEAGQKVGLVGYSGGGKTSFVNLIMGLYDVTDGKILIDGQDINMVSKKSLMESIAMIPQDPTLFHRSIMENIRYGKISASNEEVIEASKQAHAHEFIEKLPDGYNSLVGERGIKLSGGQRQRIAIARAVLKDAPILILDEATSQLDSLTEKLIQESMFDIMQGKTTIVIAHRLSTLMKMDRIVVFDKGKIVEDGSHQELLDKGGLYKTFWKAQAGGFLGDDFMNN
jgi:ATP-binding cassette, subfamily B, bacterial